MSGLVGAEVSVAEGFAVEILPSPSVAALAEAKSFSPTRIAVPNFKSIFRFKLRTFYV